MIPIIPLAIYFGFVCGLGMVFIGLTSIWDGGPLRRSMAWHFCWAGVGYMALATHTLYRMNAGAI